ncbi:MAG: protein-glutamate O-methyltransferase CheR [Magnetococcales bacterium]|nr:protein-glutamate O-methyltransferase CheR [Magnetococcales bacterium]
MAISKEEFNMISEILKEYSGIVVNPGKEYLIENRLNVLLAQNGCENYVQFYKKIKRDLALRSKFIDALTTNETLWFRDNSFFGGLTDVVIPQLLEHSKKQKVRIWSAASSTGQEPYSVAMLLDYVGRKNNIKFDINRFSILGTDISPTALQTAKQARYSKMTLSRGMRDEFLPRYFIKQVTTYEITPNIRNIVTFKPFNLKEHFDSLGKFDLILCRNVLIYFSDDFKRQIFTKMRNTLSKNGYLAIGASESPRGLTTEFKQVRIGQSVMYQAG